jgi:hypothetical protein
MIRYARPSDLPETAQRVVAWCIAGWTLRAEPGSRGRRYRLDPPVPAPQPPRGPNLKKPIVVSGAETAIASPFLVGCGDGLFGNDTAQSWTARDRL